MARGRHAQAPLRRIAPSHTVIAVVTAAAALFLASAALTARSCSTGTGQGATARLIAEGGAHVAPAAGSLTLTEEVTLPHADPDAAWDLTVELVAHDAMDTDLGRVGGGCARLRSTSDTVTLPVELDASDLAGCTVVAHATLSLDGEVVREWDGTEDGQAVIFPRVTLSAADGGIDVPEGGSASVHIGYDNLEPGETYSGTIALVDALTSASAATIPFELRAEGVHGSEDVPLDLPATGLSGRTCRLVAQLGRDGTTLATCGPEGTPAVALPAIDPPAEAVVALVEDGACIERTVALRGLVPGEAYAVTSRALDERGAALEGSETTVSIVASEDGTATATVACEVASDALTGGVPAFEDELRRQGQATPIVGRTDAMEGAQALPAIASASAGAHTGLAAEPTCEDASVKSAITLQNLVPGREYELAGALRLADGAGSDLGPLTDGDGEPVAARCAIVGREGTTPAELVYAFDASGLAGASLRACEELLLDGNVVARSDGDVVRVPEASVVARGSSTGAHEEPADGDAAIDVHVGCGNLCPGDATATVRVYEEGGLEAIGSDGRPAEATVRIPDGACEADVTIPVDASALAGGALTAQATVEVDGRRVATAGGALDECARVSIPAASVTLADGETGAHVTRACEATRAVACVSCHGIDPTLPHAVEVSLADADTKEPVAGADGVPLTWSADVEAAGDGTATAEVETELDARGLLGRSVVAVARLTCEGAVVAESDATDPAALLRLPSAEVSATLSTGSPEATVAYRNLEPGLAYEASAYLGDEEATPVGTCTFTPDGPDGIVAIALDGDTVASGAVDVTAAISLDGTTVASAAGAREASLPEISGSLSDPDGARRVPAASVTLRDSVSYRNLVPGTEYTLMGEVVDAETGMPASPSDPALAAQATDAHAGLPADTPAYVTGRTYHLDSACPHAGTGARRTTLGVARSLGLSPCAAERQGVEETTEPPRVTATESFVPTTPDGTVELDFEMDAAGLTGRSLAVRETLAQEGRELAHEDTDAAGSVAVAGTPESAARDSRGLADTGERGLAVVCAATGCALVVTGAYAALGLREAEDAVAA